MGSLLWVRRRQRGGVDLLEVGGDSGDLLIVEPLGDVRHGVGAVLAQSALPHRQLKGGVTCVLSAQVRDRRRFAGTAWSVAIVAGLQILRRVANLGELLAALDE